MVKKAKPQRTFSFLFRHACLGGFAGCGYLGVNSIPAPTLSWGLCYGNYRHSIVLGSVADSLLSFQTNSPGWQRDKTDQAWRVLGGGMRSVLAPLGIGRAQGLPPGRPVSAEQKAMGS